MIIKTSDNKFIKIQSSVLKSNVIDGMMKI